MGLGLPVRVQGFDPDGSEWHEMTNTQDASYGGALLTLRHAHAVGQVVLLSLPLPRAFRRYSLVESSYRTYGLIRSSRPAANGCEIGVMFLGRNPPRGFQENPGGRYLLDGDTPVAVHGERRRYERLPLFVNLSLRRAGASGEEQTVTENVSRGGARVLTTLPVAAGEMLVVSDLSRSTSASAIVRHVYVGPDRITRLNLQFPDLSSLERLLAAAGAPPLPAGDTARGGPDPKEGGR